jgi:hypothetical protein
MLQFSAGPLLQVCDAPNVITDPELAVLRGSKSLHEHSVDNKVNHNYFHIVKTFLPFYIIQQHVESEVIIKQSNYVMYILVFVVVQR